MALHDGERQVAPSRTGIRRDHVARYEWAAGVLGQLAPDTPTPERPQKVIDLACGVGYGAGIIAETGLSVLAVDRDEEAIAYAREHYRHPRICFVEGSAEHPNIAETGFFAAVCFETLEHLDDPAALLRGLRRAVPTLLLSVPNQAVFPFTGQRFHRRHYTRDELAALLAETGWAVTDWLGQADAYSEVAPGVEGRTIVVRADRAAPAVAAGPAAEPLELGATPAIDEVPGHVVILGLGPSLEAYVDLAKRLGGRRALCDEVWGINSVAGVVQCDRVFHMDDIRVQLARATAQPESNIARMVDWMRGHPGPIYTSRPHPDFPGLVAYPLEDVINSCGIAYFNSTAAYAVAYAVHIGVKQISCFGFDFTYPDSHKAEKGRACVEFHLGIGKARGITIGFPAATTLMDANAPFEERVYGYDTLEVEMEGGGDDPVAVTFRAKAEAEIPTAATIEARYDHGRHPNRLVEQQGG